MGDMLLLAALLLAMGPDPGGHTGDTVTPNTTKRQRQAGDPAAGRQREDRARQPAPLERCYFSNGSTISWSWA